MKKNENTEKRRQNSTFGYQRSGRNMGRQKYPGMEFSDF